jgi:hypothetical protein
VPDDPTVDLGDANLPGVGEPAACFVRAQVRLAVELFGESVCNRRDRACVRLLGRPYGEPLSDDCPLQRSLEQSLMDAFRA